MDDHEHRHSVSILDDKATWPFIHSITFGEKLSISLRLQSQSHPCSRAHWNTSKCSPIAAAVKVPLHQGHPFFITHCSMSNRPHSATTLLVHTSHGHFFLLDNLNIDKPMFLMAYAHASLSHGHLLALAYVNMSSRPWHIAWVHTRLFNEQPLNLPVGSSFAERRIFYEIILFSEPFKNM